MPGTERRMPELPSDNDEGRGEFARESEEFVRESNSLPCGSEGVGARSWSPEAWRGMSPLDPSPLPEPVEAVELSRYRFSGLPAAVTGMPPGVFVPVPEEDNDGDPDGVEADPYFWDDVELYESKCDVGRRGGPSTVRVS